LKIPKYYHANLFINYKLIIGYASAILAEAANNGISTISLIDLFPFKGSNSGPYIKKYLEKNLYFDSLIYYPSNIVQIKKLLNETIHNKI